MKALIVITLTLLITGCSIKGFDSDLNKQIKEHKEKVTLEKTIFNAVYADGKADLSVLE